MTMPLDAHRQGGEDGAPPFVAAETPTIIKLARLCRDESICSLCREPYTPCFCLALFHRAIAERDNAAWTALYEGYTGLVRHWLGSRPDDRDEEVSAVFERFWHAVDGPKLDTFPSLAAVLSYLRACAYTVRADRARARHARCIEVILDDVTDALPASYDVADTVAGHIDAAGLWGTVRSLLFDERERLVLYLSYTMDFSPREIQQRHAGHFADVTEVYRLKRNGLDRLRRAPEIRAHRTGADAAVQHAATGRTTS